MSINSQKHLDIVDHNPSQSVDISNMKKVLSFMPNSAITNNKETEDHHKIKLTRRFEPMSAEQQFASNFNDLNPKPCTMPEDTAADKC